MSKTKQVRGREDARAVDTSNRVSPARLSAFDMLRRVETESAFAAPLLAAIDERLSTADRALVYELVLGVLRNQLWLDRVIEFFAGRAAEKLDAAVRVSLRLGVYQLRFLTRIPASAAVNESVALVRRGRLRSAAPFVNAVLRRATREIDFNPAANVEDEVERLAVETSHPVWMLERWRDAFGYDETAKLAHANNRTPPVAFRINLEDESEAILNRLSETGADVEQSKVAPQAWRVKGAGRLLRELAACGKIYLQDEASQLVAHVVAPRAGERILDVCAAPGSKTTHLRVVGDDVKFIVAGDLHVHRLQTLRSLAERQNLNRIWAIAYNAEAEFVNDENGTGENSAASLRSQLPFHAESFDCALVDAPCTGTGTLRHNPEIRWRITPSDVQELARKQQKILRNAASCVRGGGRLIYSTCSLEREENEAVVKEFLRTHADWKLAPIDAFSPLQNGEGMLRTFPHRDDADGFFIAALARR